MKAQDLQKMSVEELKKALAENRKELFNARFKHGLPGGQLENVRSIPATKRNIARILTVLKQKEA